MMLLPDWIIFFLAVGGGSALILGVPRYGVALLTPAALRWILWPVLSPLLEGLPAWVALIAIPLVLLFGGILVLQRLVVGIYGGEAGGHVAGSYLVRSFDAIARGLFRIAQGLFRYGARLARRLGSGGM